MEDIEDYESLPNSSVATNMVAGAIAGVTEHSLMFPFDAIKVRGWTWNGKQTQLTYSNQQTRMQLVTSQPTAIYSGVLNAISRITSSEGSVALWRGVNSVLVGAGPAHALSFAMYEFCRDNLRVQGDDGHQILADGA
jgi:solute carrier family 25 iron transporter 28/37